MRGLAAADDPEWADRSRHWARRGSGPKDKRIRRQRSRDPLILAGYGVSLRIEAGTLLIRNGFTHHPTEAKDLSLLQRRRGPTATGHHVRRQR
jgi:CRISP-associated protein Cas1